MHDQADIIAKYLGVEYATGRRILHDWEVLKPNGDLNWLAYQYGVNIVMLRKAFKAAGVV